MIKNYFTIAWRNLWKNKLFSMINVLSLAIGISASFVIGLMAYYDFSFDTFHKDEDLKYRISTAYSAPQGKAYNYGVTVPLTKYVNQGMTGIDKSTMFFTAEHGNVMHSSFTKAFNNPERIIYADADFFGFFDYKWLAGDLHSALHKPNEIVLTENRAKKYFPNRKYHDLIGETLTYDDSVAVTIKGVVANFKRPTDFTFEEFISLETAQQSYLKDEATSDNWNNTNSNTQLFVKLNDKNSLTTVQDQLDALAVNHEGEFAIKYDQHRTFDLQPLRDIHFNVNGIFDFTPRSANKMVLLSLLCIAVFLLALGCINFVNLSTARASQRAKEIGIRKTLGSSRNQLVWQFLIESFLLTFLASLLSVVLAKGLLKVFADFIPSGVQFGLFADPAVVISTIILIILVSLVSGFYPALVLSSFKPITVLKRRVFPKNNGVSLRKGLIVFQFIIAQVFIISTFIVAKQIRYLMTEDMGFKSDAISYVRTPWHDRSMQKRMLFIQKLNAIPQIEKVSLGGSPPASFTTHATGVDFVNGDKNIHTDLELLYGDSNYLELYDIKLLAGRKLRNDTIQEYIINEACLKTLGFKSPQEAIGQVIGSGEDAVPIVGVMQDFHQRSLKSKIEPMAFVGDWNRSQYSQFNTIHFQLNSADVQNWPQLTAAVEDIWKSIYPEFEFKLQFVDDTIVSFYESERSMTKLLNWATGLSILLSCLGLLGLVIYATERRIKEIGIRKVLGASVMQINILLCKDYLTLVIIAFLIALPLAWYGMHEWLQNYAFKTTMSWWIFLLSGLGMVVLTLIVMSLKTIVTAWRNPINSLRNE